MTGAYCSCIMPEYHKLLSRMLKIIHTSDWHIGHRLYGYDRHQEFEFFFSSLSDIVKREEADVMIVSGDIFDLPAPSAASQHLFTDALIRIRRESPGMAIILIAGNHDSASRLEAGSALWREIGVEIAGGCDMDDIERNLKKIGDKGIVAAAPYIVRHFNCNGAEDNRESAIFRMLEQACADAAPSLPAVLAAHVGVHAGHTGDDSPGHTVGNLDTVDISIFGRTWRYVALGHIHRPCSLSETVRYCGSPLPVGFDEDYPHGVSVVSISEDAAVPPEVKMVEIEPLRPLVTFPSRPSSWKEVAKSLATEEWPENAYIRLNLIYEPDTQSDIREQAVAALRHSNVRFCTIKFSYPFTDNDDSGVRVYDVDEFTRLTPDDIAADFFASKGFGADEVESLRSLLHELEQDLE